MNRDRPAVSDWWKWTSAGLAAFIVASLTFAVGAATRPAVSEKRVREIVQTQSLWSQDRGRVLAILEQLADTQRELKINQAALTRKLEEVRLELAGLTAREKGRTVK